MSSSATSSKLSRDTVPTVPRTVDELDADRAKIDSAITRTVRRQMLPMLEMGKVHIDRVAEHVPSYVRAAITTLTASLERWTADEAAIDAAKLKG